MSKDAAQRTTASTQTRAAVVHPAPHSEQELILHLEPDQLVNETLQPVPRAILSRSATLGLWGLRVFCVSVSAMVLYTFIDRLQ